MQKYFSEYADRKGRTHFRGKACPFPVLITHYQNGASTLHAGINGVGVQRTCSIFTYFFSISFPLRK